MNKLNGRYIRQIPLIGTQGQEKLQSAKVAIIGVGALGTVAAELLVRSGVGSILLIDRDVVELSNLQRQSLFANSDISSSKVVAAKRRLLEINPEITIEIAPVHLSAKNISQTISDKINLVLDCTDNMNTRFLINDYTKKNMINNLVNEHKFILKDYSKTFCKVEVSSNKKSISYESCINNESIRNNSEN